MEAPRVQVRHGLEIVHGLEVDFINLTEAVAQEWVDKKGVEE